MMSIYGIPLDELAMHRESEDPIRVQCEDCDRWVPKTDSVFLEGCARELCIDCASDRPSEDWK